MSWIDRGPSFVIESWEMRLSIASPADGGLANLLFPRLPLRSPRWVLREPFWLGVPFPAPIHCSVFVRDMTI